MDEPPAKTRKNTHSEPLDSGKRKQVDAHVQAFLKAILNHAQGKSRNKSKVNEPKKETRDVETQTDDNLSLDEILSTTNYPYNTESGTYDISCVPNREMYSKETLMFASQHGNHYDQVQQVVNGGLSEAPQYFSCDTQTYTTPWSNRSSNASFEMRKVISEWVDSYKQWFFQNFGVDIPAVNNTIPNASQNLSHTNTMSVSPLNATADTTSSCVLSRPPVSYIVAEGSLCMPDNQTFSPYVSLLPSFYAPDAFNNTFNIPASQPAVITPMCIPMGMQPVLSPQTAPLTTVPSPSMFPSTQPLSLGSIINSSSQLPCSLVSTIADTSMQTDLTSLVSQPSSVPSSFVDLPSEIQTSAVFAALALPVSNGRNPTICQWGPLLRYGTYGRLPSKSELSGIAAKDTSSTPTSSEQQNSTSSPSAASDSTTKKMPPPPPTFILLRRQAMICALQIACRDRGGELFYKEKEGTIGQKIDYGAELDIVVEKSINLRPVYLFTNLSKLPSPEKIYFLGNDACPVISQSRASRQTNRQHLPATEMFACDILIGDVLIACACSTHKSQAKQCAARQAFHLFSRPCFLVGSIRCWEAVEYLVLCLSSKADLVPQLPPFLSDPFESLTKKDRTIDPEESFEVVNPKPHDDLWLYLANLTEDSLDDASLTDKILAQSAEFSQMALVFEIELNTEDGTFVCSGLVDNQRCATYRSDENVSRALCGGAMALLQSLRETQPVVGLQSDMKALSVGLQHVDPLWGVPDYILVDTLMWGGREERDRAIALEQLYRETEEGLCGPPPSSPSPVDGNRSPYLSTERLEHAIQTYAASALVTPIRIPGAQIAPGTWSSVHKLAKSWGLLSDTDHRVAFNHSIIICKRAPLPRLKRSLFEKTSFGCFRMLSVGNLSPDALKRLFAADPLIYDHVDDADSEHSSLGEADDVPSRVFAAATDGDDPYADEPVTRLLRHFRSTAPPSATAGIKIEPTTSDSLLPPAVVQEDCMLVSAELNQPSNAIEILDDLPRTLIPGIDF